MSEYIILTYEKKHPRHGRLSARRIMTPALLREYPEVLKIATALCRKEIAAQEARLDGRKMVFTIGDKIILER